MPEEDRAKDTGNMHIKLVKIARVIPEISSRTDKQIDPGKVTRHTAHYGKT